MRPLYEKQCFYCDEKLVVNPPTIRAVGIITAIQSGWRRWSMKHVEWVCPACSQQQTQGAMS